MIRTHPLALTCLPLLAPDLRADRADALPDLDAAIDMRRAVELDPLSARYRRDLSFLLIAAPTEKFIENETEKASIEHGEAQEQARLAMELDPTITSYLSWYESFK